MKPLLIRSGYIIDPGQGIDEIGSLLIADGKISWLGKGKVIPPHTDYDVLNAQGLIVCPGFVDLHCHLRQPGFEAKETIASGTRAAARGGFTTVCCMPNTSPPLDSQSIVYYVKSITDKEGVVRVLPIGCVSKERKGHELAPMDELASAGVIGFSDDGDPVLDSSLMKKALEWSLTINLPIIDHCEDTSRKRGLYGLPAAAEESMVARDLDLAELTGGWIHIAHASTRGSVELIHQAKDRGIRVTAEVTPHHLTLTGEMVTDNNTNAKVNPPLRTKQDTEALIEGLRENVIDIITTDHAPHTKADKECEFALAAPGISGFETALGSLMSLVHDGQLTMATLIAKLTSEPAKIIGNKYGKLSSLTVGAPADITIFHPDLEWTVDTRDFASKGRNTPLDGSRLKGKVIATIAQGKLVYKDNSVRVKERITDKVNYG
ncbi:dihydroorotase [Chloroflexota bacterium]